MFVGEKNFRNFSSVSQNMVETGSRKHEPTERLKALYECFKSLLQLSKKICFDENVLRNAI